MKKIFYYIVGVLMIIFSILWFWTYNFTYFSLIGFVLPLLPLITGIIFLYFGKEQKHNSLVNISMGISTLLLVGYIYNSVLSLILTLSGKPGAYGEFYIPLLPFNILLIIAFIFAIIGLIIYKNKE